MWKQATTDEFDARHRRWAKKHPAELTAVINNLDTYYQTLSRGTKPLQIKFGFIHPERLGVVAIDQRGGGRNLAQTRLYVYPDELTETLHLLTLGDKTTQKTDVTLCHQYVFQLRTAAAPADESHEAIEDL